MPTSEIDADYLVVGAGAMGMAFTDALADHAEVKVALIDRRHGVGGHWLDAYPFVRLHQASAFYGVASTLLGDNRLQQRGPETGLSERATAPEICAYYARVLADRMQPSGKVDFYPSSDYLGDRTFVSRVSGRRYTLPDRCRVVDARYLAPDIPSIVPPPFEVEDGARVVPVNDLVRVTDAPSQYVVVGAGKTATDSIVWLLAGGVDPDAICWVRPRDPWMVNRAVLQPDPATFFGMFADTMAAAASAESLDDLFLRLEDAGVMIRVDTSVLPTMAKAPTLATWELAELRKIDNVVRRGHIRSVRPGHLVFDDGSVEVAKDALVVHCAASGLKYPGRVPIWRDEGITLQAVRAGFPCLGAALIGYVEATRDDDAEKNRVCSPTPYGNSLSEWVNMNVLGAKAVATLMAEPDINTFATGTAINPARVPSDHPGSAALDEARARLQAHLPAGLARMAELVHGG